MWSRRTVLVASGLTLVRGTATGQSGTAPGRDALGANQVSLEISDYPLLFAPVRINGTPVQALVNRLPVVAGLWDQHPLKLLLDTGAPMCNIDTLFSRVPTGEIVSKDLILGSMNLPIQWRVKDLAVTRQALGSAGTLGNNLLRQYAVFVDVRNRLIYLEP